MKNNVFYVDQRVKWIIDNSIGNVILAPTENDVAIEIDSYSVQVDFGYGTLRSFTKDGRYLSTDTIPSLIPCEYSDLFEEER